jgi:DNA invertase Pin-like site-specific DNA recombinase
MKIGYARVSTKDQSLDLQLDALREAGCKKFFSDVASGAKAERVGLDKAIDQLRKSDVLVVWRLDRLGRSLSHLIALVNELQDADIGFKSLHENIDTTSNTGKLIFHIFGALSEFERDLIRERTKAGLRAARARGKLGGRPKSLNISKIKRAKRLYADETLSIAEICSTLGVSKATLYRYLKTEP